MMMMVVMVLVLMLLVLVLLLMLTAFTPFSRLSSVIFERPAPFSHYLKFRVLRYVFHAFGEFASVMRAS